MIEPRVQSGPDATRFTEIHHFPLLDSTNRYLLEAATEGAPDGLVALADAQTSGRGRRGRMWDSKPGSSLLCSVLLRPRSGEQPHRFTMALGLAITQACSAIGGFDATLKWPNDVVVQDRKLAGVLAESVTEGGDVTAVVVGCGVNLNWGELPASLVGKAVSADRLAGYCIDRDVFLQSMLNAFHAQLSSPEELADAYRRRCSTLGREVRVELTDGLTNGADGMIYGTAIDIDDSGALIVEESNGTLHTFTIGDVVHLRPVE